MSWQLGHIILVSQQQAPLPVVTGSAQFPNPLLSVIQNVWRKAPIVSLTLNIVSS